MARRIKTTEPQTNETSMTINLDDVRDRLRAISKQLDGAFVQRKDALRCALLAMLTQQNFMYVGTPGTAKTALAMALYSHIQDAAVFEKLCGSFTTKDELLGPVDIQAFKEGRWQRSTQGFLPQATHAFLDELLKMNEGTTNSTLDCLNERRYDGIRIPLRVCGAATNWPEVMARTPNTEAFYDRIVLRCAVEGVEGDDAEVEMMKAGDTLGAGYVPRVFITVAELDAAFAHIRDKVTMTDGIRRHVSNVRKRLAKEKIEQTDRRIVRLQLVLRAAAWLAGRDAVTLEDFESLRFVLWHGRDQVEKVKGVLDTVDHETVQACVKACDEALREYRSWDILHGNARVNNAPAVAAKLESACDVVTKQLDEVGATRKGKKQISGLIDSLGKAFEKVNSELPA